MVALIERGFIATLARDGRNLKILRSGNKFLATVNQLGALDMMDQLGDDPRADGIIELAKTGAPSILRNDLIEDTDSGEQWKVIRKKFSCPRYALQFEVSEVTDKDA